MPVISAGLQRMLTMSKTLVEKVRANKREAQALRKECIEKTGFTDTQLLLLSALLELSSASQTKLVKATGIDRSTMTDLVNRLEGQGNLSRKRNGEDKRAYVVSLTAKGVADAKRYCNAL